MVTFQNKFLSGMFSEIQALDKLNSDSSMHVEKNEAIDNTFKLVVVKMEFEEEEMSLLITNIETCQEIPDLNEPSKLVNEAGEKEEFVITIPEEGAIEPECYVGTSQEDTAEFPDNPEIDIEEKQPNSNEKYHIMHGLNATTQKESMLNSNEKNRRKLFENEAKSNVLKLRMSNVLKLRKETLNSYRIMDYTDSIPTNESKNIIAPQKYQCQLGHSSCFPNRSHLYTHYARVHFKQEIHSLIGDIKICPVCHMEHRISYNMITHVGSVHSYVDKFLPLEYQIQVIPMGSNIIRKSITKPPKKTHKYEKHKCPVCEYQFSQKSNLNRHMGNKHPENDYKLNLINKNKARRRSLNDQVLNSPVHSDVVMKKEN